VEREIRANDHIGRRKYLKDFSAAYRTYESVLTPADVQEAVQPADLVLIADYHALPACQRFAGALLEQRALVGDRPVVLGVETIFARDQHIIDEWWRREIDEHELRERMRFQLDWGYEWNPFYELLVTSARARRCDLRAGLHAARRFTQDRSARPPRGRQAVRSPIAASGSGDSRSLRRITPGTGTLAA
jgi:uncharacterized iron-regulated protein